MDNYETILARMKERYSELSGNDVPELSDIDIRLKVLAGEIFNDEVNLDFVVRQMFASTAQGEYLDMHAADSGLTRKPALKSKGTVRFWLNEITNTDILVPEGTVVATSGADSVRFITDADAVITAGDAFVTVSCTAEQGGASGNVGAHTINMQVTGVIGIDHVDNLYAFKGGANAEDDTALRKRILNSYTAVSNGSNAAYYKRLALSVEGVKSANVAAKVRGAGTVDIYISGDGTTVSTDLVARVNSLVSAQRELNVDVQVYPAQPVNANLGIVVYLKDGYDINDVGNNVENALYDYFDRLEVGESVHENLLGRVILSAEGVYNYDWMNNYHSRYMLDPDAFAVLNSVVIEEGSL